MKIDVRLSGDDLAHLAFVAEPTTRSNQHRLMAIEGHLDVMAYDTLAALLDGAQQFLATVSAEIDRVARAGVEASAAAAEVTQHNDAAEERNFHCVHVMSATEIYFDDSAGTVA